MSGLLSMRRAAAPRHAAPRGPSRAPQQVNQSAAEQAAAPPDASLALLGPSVSIVESDLLLVPSDLSIVSPPIPESVARPLPGPASRPRMRESSRRQLDFQRRLQLSRAGLMAKNVALVIGAVIVLFGAVLLLLVAANWAGDRQHGPETSSSTAY